MNADPQTCVKSNLVFYYNKVATSTRRTKKIISAICRGKTDLVDVADHVEGDLGQMVVFAVKDLLEAGDGLLNGHQLPGVVGEHLRHLHTCIIGLKSTL